MMVRVRFFSYFRDLTGCDEMLVDMPDASTLGDVMNRVQTAHPRLRSMDRSTLTAVGFDYQTRDYVIRSGDEVSLFPPVQGG